MSAQIEVLKSKYADLRERIVAELERVEARLQYYADGDKDKQVAAMEEKYIERRDKLFVELDRVDSRLQSYASMKSTSQSVAPQEPKLPPKKQKMYRGIPIA